MARPCATPTLTEDEIKETFVKAMNIYLGNRKEIIRNIETARNILCDTSELEEEKKTQADEMNVTAELIHKLVGENARVAIDQEEYDRKWRSDQKKTKSEKYSRGELKSPAYFFVFCPMWGRAGSLYWLR